MAPLRAHGVEVMSIGFMIDPEQPMAWRGPMVTQALPSCWVIPPGGDLDYLVVDMPQGGRHSTDPGAARPGQRPPSS